MSIEHYPDPCGPDCVAKGSITDTSDGREHDSCPTDGVAGMKRNSQSSIPLIGSRIRALRVSQGKTQEQLAFATRRDRLNKRVIPEIKRLHIASWA